MTFHISKTLSLRVLLVATLLIVQISCQLQELRGLGEWSVLEYEFPSDEDLQNAQNSGEYVRGNGVPIDMAVDYKGSSNSRVFVTVPRFSTGIPITFGTLSGNHGPGGPIIRGYPSYSWNSNQGNNCDGFTSVFRVAIDQCRRLWVLDAGKIGDNQTCPPQLVVFNLDDDQIVLRYKFPANQYKISTSLFITPIVDVRDATPGTPTTCPNTMVYIADVNGFGIIVYDLLQNKSWRVQNKYTYPSPYAGTFTIAGESFDLMDGIFGMAVTPNTGNPTGERVLYFHALASNTEQAVPLRVLDNSSLWEANVEAMPRAFVEIGNRGAQASAQAMDRNGNLFFGLVGPIAIGCWDSHRSSYGRDTIKVVAQNDKTLQFISGMKIVLNNKGTEELWALSCRFQKVMTGTLNPQEINFRIQAIEVNSLLGGQTRCSSAGLPTSGFNFPRV